MLLGNGNRAIVSYLQQILKLFAAKRNTYHLIKILLLFPKLPINHYYNPEML